MAFGLDGWTLTTTLTESSVITEFFRRMVPPVLSGTSALRFTRLFAYYLSNRGSAAVEPPWQGRRP